MTWSQSPSRLSHAARLYFTTRKKKYTSQLSLFSVVITYLYTAATSGTRHFSQTRPLFRADWRASEQSGTHTEDIMYIEITSLFLFSLQNTILTYLYDFSSTRNRSSSLFSHVRQKHSRRVILFFQHHVVYSNIQIIKSLK